MSDARVLPFGDGAVLVELATVGSVATARRARRLAAAIDALRATDRRLSVPVAAAASVLVPYDARTLDGDEVASLLEPVLTVGSSTAAYDDDDQPTEHVLHVRYGGDDGPDLDAVAAEAGTRRDDVVELHASTAYEVLFLGFAPGFAYLGDLPRPLAVPRLATPRTRVPAGSVAIAGTMTAVYPHASAGGWRILGRTDARLFDPEASPPSRLRPGDRVRFEPL